MSSSNLCTLVCSFTFFKFLGWPKKSNVEDGFMHKKMDSCTKTCRHTDKKHNMPDL